MMSVFCLFVLGIFGMCKATCYNFAGSCIEIDYWAGAGSNETVIVIDWNQTNGPYITESHAWGYRWSGTEYLSDALTAIDAAGPLDIVTGYGGAFLNDAYYYDPLIDTDDHTSENYTGWWACGESTDGGKTWSLNGGGLTGEVLHDESIEGMNMDFTNWTLDTITVPVPEPLTICLFAFGGLIMIRRGNSLNR